MIQIVGFLFGICIPIGKIFHRFDNRCNATDSLLGLLNGLRRVLFEKTQFFFIRRFVRFVDFSNKPLHGVLEKKNVVIGKLRWGIDLVSDA